MENQKALIFNIQKFSLHDGPGIRTVIFFKGCPLRCQWCANPESQSNKIQIIWDASTCIDCRKCISACPEGALSGRNMRMDIDENKCKGWKECLNQCPTGSFKVEGEYKTIQEIIAEVMKDVDFYEESGGGVTLSGGEVLQQAHFATELLKGLKEKNIHAAAETTGYAAPKVFEEFIEHLDLLLFDIKHYDTVKHKEKTGVNNTRILQNMRGAVQRGKKVIARIPVIPGFNDSIEDAKKLSELLVEIGIKEVNLLPFHQFGEKKYELLGLDYKMGKVRQLHPEDLQEYRKVFIDNGLDCIL